MSNMHTDLPKTINEALKILAYNDYFWSDPLKGPYQATSKRSGDREIVGRSTICVD